MNLSPIARSIAVLALFGTAFAALPAEARFGKASAPASSSTEQSKSASTSRAPQQQRGSQTSGSHEASAVEAERGGDYHGATAVGTEPRYERGRGGYDRDDGYYRHRRYYRRGGGYVIVQPAPVYSSGYVYVEPEPTYAPPPPAVVYEPPRRDDELVQRFDLGGQAEVFGNGVMVGLQMRMDFQKFGFDLRYDRMSLLAEDGSNTFDTIQLAQGSLTYGLLTGDRGRLRAHLGVYSAFAPDVVMAGPSVGMSTTVQLLGPLTAEADGQLVLIPFTAVDTHAGLGLKLGPIEGRAGMRLTYLNDQGRVDGVAHADAAVGPYLGLALVL